MAGEGVAAGVAGARVGVGVVVGTGVGVETGVGVGALELSVVIKIVWQPRREKPYDREIDGSGDGRRAGNASGGCVQDQALREAALGVGGDRY